ncbi:unnamed protein product [Notodromas monacha]|uniref:Uncharacterized protein n=1 Tax=Notodromas monacha TaxID=399045 RepID=A0A7R9BEM7_9CRUS|nr:unnamed protein product [Notodromas monacha]CAG0913391.1 unnamed protein product [Notodromas monacha]
MSVLGIDFGTDCCYVSVARAGGIETIANDYSLRNTPSCISFGEKTRVMGVAAKNQQTTNMKNTVTNFKRFLGRQFRDPLVQEELKRNLPFEVMEQPDGSVGIKVRYQNEEQVFSAEQVTAMLLTKLRDIADAAIGGRTVDCVISVPSYFTDPERRALLDAATIAGFNVLKQMNDSTAVALAYGLYRTDLPNVEEKPRNVVFVDVGYSSMQVYAAAYNKGKLKMLSCVSDPTLGGRDLDLALAQHFRNEFIGKYKMDVATNSRAWLRLTTEVEKLKKQMSANSTQLPFGIECLMDDKDELLTADAFSPREDFELLIAPLLERAHTLLKRGLADCGTFLLFSSKISGLKLDDIYGVEIVGGSTRVPAVKNLIKDVFGQTPSTTLNQDEAVSRGCALQSAMLSPAFKVREFNVTDIQIYPIILKWRGPNHEDGQMEVFPKYHSVPFSKMLTFYRSDAFTLEAYYDGDVPLANNFIGQYRVQGVKPTATGESSKVKVKARINVNGIFLISSASLIEPVPPKEEDAMDASEAANAEGPKTPQKNDKQNGPANTQDNEKMETDGTEKISEGHVVISPRNSDNTGVQCLNSPNDDTEYPFSESQSRLPCEEELLVSKVLLDAPAEEKTGKEDKKKPSKPTVRSVDLPIESLVFQLSKERLDLFTEIEGKLIANDKQEKERADARNAVEEYVYDMRGKVNESLGEFLPPQERESFLSSLDATEEWLYNEGEDCARNVYVDRLVQLRHVGDPPVKRKREFEERPRALDELGGALQLVRKALDLYAAKDERLSLDASVSSILNKPKPKPKVETPPEEPAKTGGKSEQHTDQKATEGDAGATGDRSGEKMEVDS